MTASNTRTHFISPPDWSHSKVNIIDKPGTNRGGRGGGCKTATQEANSTCYRQRAVLLAELLRGKRVKGRSGKGGFSIEVYNVGVQRGGEPTGGERGESPHHSVIDHPPTTIRQILRQAEKLGEMLSSKSKYLFLIIVRHISVFHRIGSSLPLYSVCVLAEPQFKHASSKEIKCYRCQKYSCDVPKHVSNAKQTFFRWMQWILVSWKVVRQRC